MNMNTQEEILRDLLTGLTGEDFLREGLKDTPKRMLSMFRQMFEGYQANVEGILGAQFHEDGCEAYKGMVIVKDTPFYSLCEHHLVPFFGKVHVGYISNERVLGLSKIPRLIKAFSRRLQIQERLTDQICKALHKHVKPLGTIVVVEARHLCMEMRGAESRGSETTTSSVEGVFASNPIAREEFLQLIRSK